MLYILTPIFCVALLCGTVFSFSNNKAYADEPAIKASAAYLNLDGGTNILNGFEGEQKEYVYFGANNNAPIKWRVLAKNDDKYGDGQSNLLLWSDESLEYEEYGSYGKNPEYAFWGTSKLRASLNGGKYYTAVSNSTDTPTTNDNLASINVNASWYKKLFKAVEEQNVVKKTDTYTTVNWGYYSSNTRRYYTDSMIATSDSYGKYNSNRLDKTAHPTAEFAKYNMADGTVWEETGGDYLFILDYYDINNTDYGFGDDGVTYANKIDSNWQSSGYFPGYYTNGNNGNTRSDYLKGEDYWLRNAGRFDNIRSDALNVCSPGNVWTDYVESDNEHKVRPAFVIDATKIAYVTATSPIVGNGFIGLKNSPSTLEYKTYVKGPNYASSGRANVREENNNLYITYDNPTSETSGNLIVLLTSKTATGGEVDYQAAVAMSSTASATKQAATSFTLPTGVSLSTHDVTIMYASAKGTNNSETIYCSYTLDSGIDVPQNITATYDGNSKWITDLTASEKPVWLDLDIYGNTPFMSVKSVEYTDNLDNPETTVTTVDIKAAGTYKVTMTAASGLKWTGDTATGGDKEFTITINKKKSTPKPKVDPPITTTPYESAGLPTLISDIGGTPGTFDWDTGEVASADKTEYSWTFTPTDANNFTVEKGTIELAFLAREMNGISVTAYNPTATVYTDTSLTIIKSYLTVEASYTDGNTEVLTSYKLEVDATDGKLVAGNNTLVISTNDDSQTITYEITGVVGKAVSAINVVQLSNSTFKYPVTAEEIKAAISRVNVQWNTGASGNLESFDDVTVSGTLDAGNSVTVTIGVSGTTATKNITIKIDKGDFDVSGITFAGDTVTYDGNNHSIACSGTLPAGVSVEYDYNGTKQTAPWEFANAGTYNITLSFTHSDANYNAITATLPATLQIDKASYTMPTGYDTKKQATYTGSAISLPANWITGLDPDVTVTYCEADGTTPFADKTAVDTYTVKAVFSVANPANYNVPALVTLTFEITDKEVYDDSGLAFTVSGAEGSGNSYTATYDPDGTITFTLDGKLLDKDGAEVTPTLTYTYEKEVDGAWVTVAAADLTDAGNYRVTVSVATGDATYADINDKVVTLKIEKADYDMSNISFSSKTEVYNGSEYTLAISGDLPSWITPSYSVDGQSGTTFSAAGTYDFTVSFTHTNDNYNPIDDMTATLTISDAVVVRIEAELEVTAYTTANTLDDLKASLKVTAIFNNDSTAEVEDYELSCNGLRDGGKFKAGNQSVTVTYKVGDEQFIYIVNNILVSPEKVALPTFKGGLNYTGVSLKPTVENFNGYDSALMTFVVDKTVPGLTVGSYKAVFALNDPENYEWATVTTLKKALFAVVYDEMVLNANEAAVDWNISKAVLTATKADGALPIFASESFIGAFADVVTLKYYKDEACTEEVAADQLAYETQYYVKAELIDTENFELDASAAQYTVKSFTYTTPAKELTIWDKIVRFLKTNWLWLVIAVVALILFITIIALIARAAKKKRERAELAEQRRFEKEEREREERKLEREERMARLSQQQQMPQMMMPQMMPQMMGQMPQMQAPQSQPAAQPASGGGMVTEAQFMQVQAELAALKAAQESAKEVAELRAEAIRSEAALRAEAALRNDINALRAGGGQDITGGMTAATLVEIVTAAMEKVLDSREKGMAQSATAAPEAAPAATQVPPDAVMTTVTTTKIDTTKKTAPTAQAAAPVRTVVRNVVAPMPVDDGRVFDVGGFYKPADPITDMDLGDETDKN